MCAASRRRPATVRLCGGRLVCGFGCGLRGADHGMGFRSRAFGLSRNTTYELIRSGEFPVPVHPHGKGKRRVLTSELWEALGVRPPE
ncbi:hypothetical protein GCM10009601_41430 [Streptomyces thermospinosisporus]|uniref:DNA-binding protein n=1 Tax=Streptomyces thermospinosisporus TaxID=161482 RepID=A0ABN1Z2I5_9ACTN